MSDTKARILDAALGLCQEKNYLALEMTEVAEAANVVRGTVVHHFLNMTIFRRDLVRYAIERRDLHVIAQAVINRDRYVRTLPRALKDEALRSYR